MTDPAVADPAPPAPPHRPTLMTVHAHPDDETIGTGGTMAKAVAEGKRVVLITCTRGEMGEIVVPEMDTPENHRRLGELRAGELERAMGHLGVTEWENLGYHDSDMMGRPGNHDPRSFWQADLDEAARPAGLVHPPLPARRHHDLQQLRRLRAPRPHPDPRRRGPGVPAGRRPGLVPGAAGTRARRQRTGGRGRRARAVDAVQAVRAGHPGLDPDRRCRNGSRRSASRASGRRPRTPRPNRLAEFEAYMAKMLVPDESITTWIDISGDPLQRKWDAIHEHVTQMAPDAGFMLFGLDGWREAWSKEAYILRESTVPTERPESDLFAGLG